MMKSTISASLRRAATALHRFAGLINQQAYRLDHGRERVVVDADPLGRLLAEVRDSIRNRDLNAGQGCECTVAIDGGEVDCEVCKDIAHQVDGHPLADRPPVDYHRFHLDWLKFIEHRPGFEAAQPRIARRIADLEKEIVS